MRLVLPLLAACTPLAEPTSHPRRVDLPEDTLRTEEDTLAADDAVVVSTVFPDTLVAGASATARVTVQNTGTATWTIADGYKLGAVDDSDPLHPGEGRIWLPDTDSVAPLDSYTFSIPLVGPATAGDYTTDWQMVHEGVRWFGGSVTHTVEVRADEDTPPDSPDLSLTTAAVLNSPPDVATWAETATITTLDFNTEGVYIGFTRRDGDGSWPDVPFITEGEDLQYTLWIVLDTGDQTYTSGCIQYWRGLERNGGPPSGFAENWYYDANRWAGMTGYQPAEGEDVGFFVTAGNARNVTDGSGSVVYERSNVVLVPFPSDAGATFTW